MNEHPTPINLSGAVVAITGGARGIGLETARHFHAQGARVVIGDLDETLILEAASSIGPRATGLVLDVTDRESFSAFLGAAEAAYGPIDVLVNNAGIMPAGRFLDEPDAVIDTQIDVNLRGPIIGMRLILPSMIERGSGHVVNVASMAGKFAIPGLSVYSATKHAVVGLSSAVRDELAGTGVSISTVMPNAVQTDLTSGLPTERLFMLKPEHIAKAIVKSIDNRREEIAVPRVYGAWQALPVLLPTRLLARIKRLLGVHRLLDETRIDKTTRGRYDDRIAGSSSRRDQSQQEKTRA